MWYGYIKAWYIMTSYYVLQEAFSFSIKIWFIFSGMCVSFLPSYDASQSWHIRSNMPKAHVPVGTTLGTTLQDDGKMHSQYVDIWHH